MAKTITPAELDGQTQIADQGAATPTGLAHIALERITTNGNPRTRRNDDRFAELVRSIAGIGVETPVLVDPLDDGSYMLIAGHGRVAACRQLGLTTIPAQLKPGLSADRARKLESALVENLVREELDPIDEARGYAELMRLRGIEPGGVAERTGISERRIKGRLELLSLPDGVQELVDTGTLTLGTARALAPISPSAPRLVEALGQRVADGRMSARDVERDPGGAVRTLADEGGPDAFCVPFTGGLDVLNVADVIARCQSAADQLGSDEDRTRMRELLADAEKATDKVRRAGADPVSPVTGEDQMLVSGSGQLVTFQRDRYTTMGFLVDPLLAADWAKRSAETLVGDRHAGQDGLDDADVVEAPDPRDDRERRARALLAAEQANRELGSMLRRLDNVEDAGLGDGVARAVVGMLVAAYGSEMAAGMRLVRAEWASQEVTMSRSGAMRTETKLMDLAEARTELDAWLTGAPGASSLVSRAFAAMAAGALALQDHLKAGQQRPLDIPVAAGREQQLVGQIAGILWGELADELPPRIHAQAKVALAIPDETSKPKRDRTARSR